MQTLRQLLAFPLYLTVIWLLWVLGRQSGVTAMALLLIGLLALALLIWAWQASRHSVSRRLWRAVASAAVVLSWVGLIQVGNVSSEDQTEIATRDYSEHGLAELRAEGQAVFVYMTADWCITCKVNERVSLASGRVAERFARDGITVMQGDWTLRDDAITAYLESFGRNGVPLYVYYPSGVGSSAHVLPQILTPDIVINALDEARQEEG